MNRSTPPAASPSGLTGQGWVMGMTVVALIVGYFVAPCANEEALQQILSLRSSFQLGMATIAVTTVVVFGINKCRVPILFFLEILIATGAVFAVGSAFNDAQHEFQQSDHGSNRIKAMIKTQVTQNSNSMDRSRDASASSP